jgi:hypothetical protein
MMYFEKCRNILSDGLLSPECGSSNSAGLIWTILVCSTENSAAVNGRISYLQFGAHMGVCSKSGEIERTIACAYH